MDVYGLTGGIGSGKSSVGELLEAYGIPVVSADELSRMVVAKGSDGLAAVVAAFGEGVLDAKGELDRRAMARIVFPDAKKRRELESILHPLIRERFEQVLDALEKGGHRLMVYEVPLLFEKNLQGDMKAVILVSADDAIRIARVRQRDNVSEEEVRQRMAAQMDEDEKRRRADYVLYNNGGLDDLRREVEHLISHFLRLPPSSAAAPPRAADGATSEGVPAQRPSSEETHPGFRVLPDEAATSTPSGTTMPPPPPPPRPRAQTPLHGTLTTNDASEPPPLSAVSTSLPPLPPLPKARERKLTPILDAAEAASKTAAPAPPLVPPAPAGSVLGAAPSATPTLPPPIKPVAGPPLPAAPAPKPDAAAVPPPPTLPPPPTTGRPKP
jgi:dephospho-CoA kinase